MDWTTADLCDQYAAAVEVAEPMLRHFGGRRRFCGRISTVRAFEDNSLVRAALERPGDGGVLVVDGGGSQRCALVGDRLGLLAVDNGWSGIVVYGAVRDSVALGQLELGLLALGTNPMKSIKRNEGQRDVAVRFAGVYFTPGHFVYADGDGLLVAEGPLV